MPVRDLEAFLPPGRARVRFIANRGANGIDGLISTAAGAAAASGARTWAVLGDLAFAHDLGGLAVAREVPNLRLLVLDNGGGGIFHFLPQAEAVPERGVRGAARHALGSRPAARGRAVRALRAVARNPAELERALAGDARVVIVPLDRARNVAVHRRLSEAAAAALASPEALSPASSCRGLALGHG